MVRQAVPFLLNAMGRKSKVPQTGNTKAQAGLIVLFGSGETSASGRKVCDWLLQGMDPAPQVAVLETPAGFEPNSAQVAGKVADFFKERLQNHHPRVTVVPARKRNTPFSPDNPDIIAPLLQADVIFLGPGSPTYAVRQLRDTLAWDTLIARHRLGTAVILASAATVAAGAHTLPVYEIYKVGEDLHWHDGLDLLGHYGLPLVFIPHWDNHEGGADLDTSRCFMGQERFARLLALLPEGLTVVGLGEHTALVIDLARESCQVMGLGQVAVLRDGGEKLFRSGQNFALAELGNFRRPNPEEGIPADVWEHVQTVHKTHSSAAPPADPPAEVLSLVEARETARSRREWTTADDLRNQIAALGWQVQDAPSGTEIAPLE